MPRNHPSRSRRCRMWLAGTLTALLVLIGPAVGGCGGDRPADPGRVKVGFLASLSGTYQAVGTDMRDGFQLYLDTHDKRLGGRAVDLVVADEGDGGPTAVPAATKLIKSDRVVALAGLVGGGSVAGVVPLLTENKVPLVAANGRPELKDPKWVWTTSFMSVEPGAAIAQYVKDHVDGPVYAIGPDYQGGWDELKGFTDAYTKAGGKLANPTARPPSPSSRRRRTFCRTSRKSATPTRRPSTASTPARPQSTSSRATASPTSRTCRCTGRFLTEGSVLDAQGPAAEGIFNVLNYSPDLDNAANRTFVADWKARHDRQPTTFAMASYDAAAVLDRAIGAINGDVTAQAVNDAIGRLGQIDSRRGLWQFRTSHAPVQKWYLRQVRNDGRALSNVVVQDLATLGN